MNSYRKEEAVEEPKNPTEVGQKRSGPVEPMKSKGDAQKVLVRGPEILKGQAQGEIAC